MMRNFCGRTRREFLWQTGGGFAGLALSGLLGDAFFREQAVAADGVTKFANPLAAKQPHGKAKAKSVIFLYMYGGPSHIDTFDPKPDAPVEIRGPFGVVPTSIPGVRATEHVPNLAKRLHQLTLIRTITHRYNSHNPYCVMTGYDGGRLVGAHRMEAGVVRVERVDDLDEVLRGGDPGPCRAEDLHVVARRTRRVQHVALAHVERHVVDRLERPERPREVLDTDWGQPWVSPRADPCLTPV